MWWGRPDRGVRGGRIRCAFHSHPGSHRRERPGPGTSHRQAGDSNAGGWTERGFTGIIAARVQSNLGFRVAGKIVERLVNAGQQVKAGQSLMRIDETDLRLAVTAKRNAVAAARASSFRPKRMNSESPSW